MCLGPGLILWYDLSNGKGTKYYSGDQIENNETGGACTTYGGKERCIQGSGGENLRESDHLKDPNVDGRITLNGSSGSGMRDMNWTDLAQDMDRWRALVDAVMGLWVPYNAGNFLTS
jgi:hypothetical protein